MLDHPIKVDALVVGSGAAGYSTACRIAQDGRKTVAIVTEEVLAGTSRNTGSDKQTYYKLGLGGDCPDSVMEMARNLFSCGSVDGDNALCEAAMSVRCFMNLVELGVPFPVNRYGEYVGYKTDHDPYARATSAGPLTSRYMTQALEQKTAQLNIPVYSGLLAVEVLKDDSGVRGLLCLDRNTEAVVVFQTNNLVLATGGPGGIYADSVYPVEHNGFSSLGIRAGAAFQNMTEWQYGLASTKPRWNVSGTYMQVLPRFVSVDDQGVEREFLLDYFQDPYEALSMVFLKGYQWPFDSAKVLTGSSVIDLLVYRETAILGRRVYLDYRQNPFGLSQIAYENLSAEAYTYLKNASACFGTPMERLLHMNAPAMELYRGKGVDLTQEMLPIALCAQHHNGGISVDLWWQTQVPGLFAVGECAGTHGITRPGGSALNAGQVGALRAAQYICERTCPAMPDAEFAGITKQAVDAHLQAATRIRKNADNVDQRIRQARKRMSICGGAIRRETEMRQALAQCRAELETWEETVGGNVESAYRYRDLLICQIACLEAMLDYRKTAAGTRGSALYTDPRGEKRQGLEEDFRFVSEPRARDRQIQQGVWNDGKCEFVWRPVREIPDQADVFESVWRGYRENRNVY